MSLPNFKSKPKYQKMLMASTMVDAIWKSRKTNPIKSTCEQIPN
jgi:hypothetical protein